MRTTNLIVCLGLALPAFAQTPSDRLNRLGGALGDHGVPLWTEVRTVVYRDEMFYEAQARLDGPGAILLISRHEGQLPHKAIVPWEDAPVELKQKMSLEHARAVAAAAADARIAAAAPDLSDRQLISSEVIQVVPEGLVIWVGKRKKALLRGHPHDKDLTVNDLVRVIAKRSGDFKYVGYLGNETVPAFDYVSDDANPPK